MKAIFITGGKQYLVTEGDTIYVEKLEGEAGSTVEFTDVLYANGIYGMPTVKGASVTCEIVKHGKQKKITIFKYKSKKKFRNKQGHRQPYTKLLIKNIEIK